MSQFDVTLERGLPCNLPAERMVLGCIILENSLLAQALEKLTPGDFFNPSNRKIFTAMLALDGEDAAIDPMTLQAKLGAAGDLTDCGGPAYIASLFDGVPRFSDIRSYAGFVEDCAIRRRQIAAGNLAIQCAYDFEESAQVQLNQFFYESHFFVQG